MPIHAVLLVLRGGIVFAFPTDWSVETVRVVSDRHPAKTTIAANPVSRTRRRSTRTRRARGSAAARITSFWHD